MTGEVTAVQQQALTVPCKKCGARAGKWCVSPMTGHPVKTIHVGRYRDAGVYS